MASIAGSLPAVLRNGRPAELRIDRPRSERPHADIGLPARAPGTAPGGDHTGTSFARTAGFVIHQLLAAMPELRGPPAPPPQTITAYRTHLAMRVHYSGPVRPVDLRI